jgi:hypothetical protein
MTPRKRKPATTWEGDMNTVVGVYIKDFPKDEWEDLCNTCRDVIHNYSADLSDNSKKNGWAVYNGLSGSAQASENPWVMFSPVRTHKQDRMEEECSDLRMDTEARYTESVYQGFLED